MGKVLTHRSAWVLIFVLSCCLSGAFFLKYVPLHRGFQLVLAPLLVILFVVSVMNRVHGLYLFVFLFPLTNQIPYFFKIYPNIPHAPVALVLCMVFLNGWLLHYCLDFGPLSIRRSYGYPLKFFFLLLFLSALITVLRYLNFFPFAHHQLLDLIVNVNGVRAGGAVMSCLFSFLSYVSGILLFGIVVLTVVTREIAGRIIKILMVSGAISLLFAIFQKVYSLELGNIPFFVAFDRINGTFKDPNSFGLFLSALFPLILSMILSTRKLYRAGLILLLGVWLFIFPSVGARSGALGVLVSIGWFVFFFLRDRRIEMKRQLAVIVAAAIVLSFSALGYTVVMKGETLFGRFTDSLSALRSLSFDELIDEGRVELWESALSLGSSHPISGVGIGAFIIEYPNSIFLQDITHRHTDSAENYILQVFSELGVIGLISITWIFVAILSSLKIYRRSNDEGNGLYWIKVGLTGALSAVFTNFLFHSYIGAFDAKYFFWLLMGLAVVFCGEDYKEADGERRLSSSIKLFVLVGVFVFTFFLYWNSTHSLSLSNSTARFDLVQSFGLYPTEKNEQGYTFTWARRKAGISFGKEAAGMLLPIRAANPGIEQYPVHVSLYTADKVFSNVVEYSEIQLTDAMWQFLRIPDPRDKDRRIYLYLETDREWQPSRYSASPDSRMLAIQIGEVRKEERER